MSDLQEAAAKQATKECALNSLELVKIVKEDGGQVSKEELAQMTRKCAEAGAEVSAKADYNERNQQGCRIIPDGREVCNISTRPPRPVGYEYCSTDGKVSAIKHSQDGDTGPINLPPTSTYTHEKCNPEDYLKKQARVKD